MAAILAVHNEFYIVKTYGHNSLNLLLVELIYSITMQPC